MYFFFNRYFTPKTVFIWLSEFSLIFLLAVLSAAVRFSFDWPAIMDYDPWFVKTFILTTFYMVIFYILELYSPEYYYPGRQMLMRLLQGTALASIALFTVYYIFPLLKAGRGVLGVSVFAIPVAIFLWRILFTRTGQLGFELPEKRILIIGSGELARRIGSEIYGMRDHGLRLMGFVDDDPRMQGQSIVNPGVIGGYGDIGSIVREHGIDRIIVALADRRARLPMSALLDCKLRGVTIDEGETFQERMTGRIPLDHLKPSWMVFSDGFKSLRSRKIIKRIFDLILASIGLVVAAPLMLVTALLIKLDSRGPVLFNQTRVGENGRLFEIHKFRSMQVDAEKETGPVWAETNDARVTRVGAVMRKLRIDELPQLINVIMGDMSFAGPRPERPFFVEKLKESIPYYEVRHTVKPGVTGWAQIKYPYGASVQDALEKLQYDIYYIKNMSPLLDFIIFFMTLKIILTGRGAR